MEGKISISGRVSFFGYDEHGELKFTHVSSNLVVNTGLDHIADQLSDAGETAMSHMAIGDDGTAPAAGQTSLISETARVALDSKTQSSNKVTYVATYNPGVGTGSVREAGILNSASNGVLLCRDASIVYDKGALDTLVINWELTISAA